MKSRSFIHGQRYKIIQINYIAGIFGRLYYITMLRLADLTGSRNAVLYTVHAMQLSSS